MFRVLGLREELAWSEMMVEGGLIESLSRGPLGLCRVYR